MSNKDTVSTQDLHSAYLAIVEMNLPTRRKCRLLTELMAAYKGAWRIVGITSAALDVFASHGFRRVSKMGINRAHLVDRSQSYTEMLTNPICDINEWWEFYYNNDRTVLSTSSENMKSFDVAQVIWFNAEGLFRSQGFAWRHTKGEITFLEKLYAQQSDNPVL